MTRVALAFLLFTLAASAAADDFTATADKIRAAMASEIRGPEDTGRDVERLPLETLEFFGLRENMKIVETWSPVWHVQMSSPFSGGASALVGEVCWGSPLHSDQGSATAGGIDAIRDEATSDRTKAMAILGDDKEVGLPGIVDMCLILPTFQP